MAQGHLSAIWAHRHGQAAALPDSRGLGRLLRDTPKGFFFRAPLGARFLFVITLFWGGQIRGGRHIKKTAAHEEEKKLALGETENEKEKREGREKRHEDSAPQLAHVP